MCLPIHPSIDSNHLFIHSSIHLSIYPSSIPSKRLSSGDLLACSVERWSKTLVQAWAKLFQPIDLLEKAYSWVEEGTTAVARFEPLSPVNLRGPLCWSFEGGADICSVSLKLRRCSWVMVTCCRCLLLLVHENGFLRSVCFNLIWKGADAFLFPVRPSKTGEWNSSEACRLLHCS